MLNLVHTEVSAINVIKPVLITNSAGLLFSLVVMLNIRLPVLGSATEFIFNPAYDKYRSQSISLMA